MEYTRVVVCLLSLVMPANERLVMAIDPQRLVPDHATRPFTVGILALAEHV
jgi:hypothetical protein